MKQTLSRVTFSLLAAFAFAGAAQAENLFAYPLAGAWFTLDGGEKCVIYPYEASKDVLSTLRPTADEDLVNRALSDRVLAATGVELPKTPLTAWTGDTDFPIFQVWVSQSTGLVLYTDEGCVQYLDNNDGRHTTTVTETRYLQYNILSGGAKHGDQSAKVNATSSMQVSNTKSGK